MKIRAGSFDLQFTHPFVLAAGTRSHTPSVFIHLQNSTGSSWAEAALPPYFSLTPQQVIHHLQQLPLAQLLEKGDAVELNKIVQTQYSLPQPVNSLLVSAVMNFTPFLSQQALYQSTLTVSPSPGIAATQLLHHQQRFNALKIKVGTGNEKEFIEHILSHSQKPFCVDANRGWKNRDEAAHLCEWLEKKGCLLIEQPFETNDLEAANWLRHRISIPVIADESICTYTDLQQKHQAFDGVNIKILKCGGPIEAMRMLEFAHDHDIKTLIGCMSESSLGCATAARLAHMADFVDLDGPYLIKNNPFTGYTMNDGKIEIEKNGIQPTTEFLNAFYAGAVTL